VNTRRTLKVAALALVAVLVLAAVAFVVWTRVAGYEATPEAVALAQSARTPQGWYVFQPPQPADTALIF
jgi:hypothetical protein